MTTPGGGHAAGMTLPVFEEAVWATWERFPPAAREGVTQLRVEPGVWVQDTDDGWCFGTCEPDPVFALVPDAPSHAIIRLYYGSFVRIEAEEEDFDWMAEIEETIRHELQHHHEWRAGFHQRDDEDDVERALALWDRGQPFPRDLHRRGLPLGRGAYLAGETLFVEHRLGARALATARREGLCVTWGAVRATVDPVDVPEGGRGEVLYCVAGEDADKGRNNLNLWVDVVVVLRVRRGWWC
jgi:hypothetical protein